MSAFAVTFFVTLGACLYKSLGLLNIGRQAYFACVLRSLMGLYRDVQPVLGWLCPWALAPSWSLVLLLCFLSGSVCGSGDFLFAVGVEGSADFSNRWHPQVQNRRAVPMGTVPWRVAEKPNMQKSTRSGKLTSSRSSRSYVLDKLLDAHSSAQRLVFWESHASQDRSYAKINFLEDSHFVDFAKAAPWINFWTRALVRNA